MLFALRTRWRMRTLMGLIVVIALAMAWLRKPPDLGPVYRLKHGNPQERMAAAVQLGMLGPIKGKFAEPLLLAALNDSDQGVCDCAAWAMDRFGSTSPALVKALVSQVDVEDFHSPRWQWQGSFYMRVEPAVALDRIKPTASTLGPLLGKSALTNPDPWIRQRAATLLHDAIQWSGGPTPDLSPLLLATLHDKEPGIRLIVVDDLARLDDETRRRAVAILLQRLRSSEPPDRLEATVGLARFGSIAEPAVKILANPLESSNLADRLGSLYLLGRLGPTAKPAVPAILRVLTARDAGKNDPDFIKRFWRQSGDGTSLITNEDWQKARKNLGDFALDVLEKIGPEAEQQGVVVFQKMLEADSPADRQRALESLTKLGPKAAVALPTLIALAEGRGPGPADRSIPDSAIFNAIQQIGRGDDLPLVEALIRLLKANEVDRRWQAASTLGHLKPPPRKAVPALIEALNDPQSIVRGNAARALGGFDGSEKTAASRALQDALRDQDFWVRGSAGHSLASYGEDAAKEAVPVIIRLLRTEDRNLRREAAEILGEFGPSAQVATAALLVALDDEIEYVRKAAERALKVVSPIQLETTDEAFDGLHNRDVSIRRAAVCDLVRPELAAQLDLDPNVLTEALRKILRDPAPNVRATAAAALARLGRKADAAIPALLTAIHDEMPGPRVLAATALGKVAPGHREAIAALSIALAEDPNVNVRNAAAAALGSMGPKAESAAPVMIRALNDLDGSVKVHVIVALGRVGPAADESILLALKTLAEHDPSINFRVWAIRALGLIGIRSDLVVPTLLTQLVDPVENIRNAAGHQLGLIRPTEKVLPRLLAVLDHGSRPARLQAVSALGMLGPEVAPEALPALLRVLREDDEAMRRGAMTSLMEFGPAAAPATQALRLALDDPSPAIRGDAERALSCSASKSGFWIIRPGAW